MPARNTLFGVGFILFGSFLLLLNKMMAEEGLKMWFNLLIPPPPLWFGRIWVSVGGILSILFGVMLLLRIINLAG
jgi:hypothetical protein